MILFWLQKQRIYLWKSCGNGRRAYRIEGYESKHWEVWRRRSGGVRWAGVRLWIQETILVVFAVRVSVAILLCALRGAYGFIKSPVEPQVDWETVMISIADGLFRKWFWETLRLSTVWGGVGISTKILLFIYFYFIYLGDIYLVPVVWRRQLELEWNVFD